MSEGTIQALPKEVKPIPSPKTIETFFKTMPDGHPDRNRVFKIRYKTPFYTNPADDYEKTAGIIIEKKNEEQNVEHDYFVMMDPDEFNKLYGEYPGDINVRNIKRVVKFLPMVEPLYYKEPDINIVRQLYVGDELYAFLNPAAVSWVNPKTLPDYDPSIDTSGYGRSQGYTPLDPK